MNFISGEKYKNRVKTKNRMIAGMSLQWFCFCFMDDIDPALIAETRVSRLGYL